MLIFTLNFNPIFCVVNGIFSGLGEGAYIIIKKSCIMILRGENKQYNSFCIVNFYQDYKLKKENKENEELQVWLQLNN